MAPCNASGSAGDVEIGSLVKQKQHLQSRLVMKRVLLLLQMVPSQESVTVQAGDLLCIKMAVHQ